jgi:hypothetical protein
VSFLLDVLVIFSGVAGRFCEAAGLRIEKFYPPSEKPPE